MSEILGGSLERLACDDLNDAVRPLEVASLHHLLATTARYGKLDPIEFGNIPPQRIERFMEDSVKVQIAVSHGLRSVGRHNIDLSSTVADWIDSHGWLTGTPVDGHHRRLCMKRTFSGETSQSIFDPIWDVVVLRMKNVISHLALTDLLSSETVTSITHFIKEALDNIAMHAQRTTGTQAPIFGVELVAFRRVAFGDFESQSSTSAVFANGLRAIATAQGLRRPFDLLEIVVADNGEGIPATMCESLSAYDRDVDFDRHSILRAMKKGVTRPTSNPILADPQHKGQGFNRMLAALSRERGYIRIWSGRACMERSMIASSGVPHEPSQLLGMHDWNTTETALVAGTSVSAIIPIGLQPSLLDPSE